MEHHRFFDLSCIHDIQYREALQDAIKAVNEACSLYVNAWMYVSQGCLFHDANVILENVNTIPRVIFKSIKPESFQKILTDLFSISNDYESWAYTHQQQNLFLEEQQRFWNTWRLNTLHPYYTLAKSKDTLGHVLDSFFVLKKNRNDAPADLESELMNLLGSTNEEKIDTLNKILFSFTSESLISYKNILLKQVESKKNEILYSTVAIKEAIKILETALKSKNIIAIKAALNPGWTSIVFTSSKQYKEALEFMNQADVQFSENSL